jgi:thioredoxin-dependent peroxiredoxin
MACSHLLTVGEPAPSFPYRDSSGKECHTRDLLGHFYLVYFYPKDDTLGCSKEACGFRDEYQNFVDRGIGIIGVSPDDEKSHQKFRAKFNLPFFLASDATHEIARAFGAWGPKKFMGREYEGVHRVTFLISPDGSICRVYPKVKPELHAKEILFDTTNPP